MKITPEEIFDITNYYTQNKNKWVTGFIWSDFIEWYKQLLYIVFRCKFYQRNISFAIGESVTGSFTIDVQREFAEEAFNILEKEDNKYITESFGISLWDCTICFHPKDIETVKYFDTIVKLTKGNDNE